MYCCTSSCFLLVQRSLEVWCGKSTLYHQSNDSAGAQILATISNLLEQKSQNKH